MTRRLATGFESGSISAGNLISNVFGTASISTATVRTGTYALRCNPTGTATGYVIIYAPAANGLLGAGSYSDATSYVRFYLNITTGPASGAEYFFRGVDTSGASKFFLGLVSDGGSGFNITSYNRSGTLLSTGTTSLSTGTWYRIGVSIGTGASASWAVKIDGTAEISGSGADLGTPNNGGIAIGKAANLNGNSVEYFFDDVSVDDTDYPGPGEILKISPNANGSTMQWTGGTGASDYTTVDEIPPSSGDYVASTAINDVALFSLVDSATAGISGTIACVVTYRWLFPNAGSTGVAFGRDRSGTTNLDLSTVTLPAATSRHTYQVMAVDPDTSSAWTTGGIDGLEIGAVEDATSGERARMLVGLAEVEFNTTGSDVSVGLTGSASSSAVGTASPEITIQL